MLFFNEPTLDRLVNYTIEENHVNDKDLGFFVNLSNLNISESLYGQLILVNCSGVIVQNQEISNTSCGVLVAYSELVVISDSTFTNSSYGVYFLESSHNQINDNLFNKNVYGLIFDYTSFCELTYNIIEDNEVYGFLLAYGSDYNLIHHNSFIDNGILTYGSHAYDMGYENQWYDSVTECGNHWSEWDRCDPYEINSHIYDLYPLNSQLERITTNCITPTTAFMDILTLFLGFLYLSLKQKRRSNFKLNTL